MLLYYSGYITVTSNMISYADRQFYVTGKIDKIYDVHGYLFVCCGKIVHVLHKECGHYICIVAPESFSIIAGISIPLIVDLNIFEHGAIKYASSTMIYLKDHAIRADSGCTRITNNVDDRHSVPLRNIAKGVFRGHTDITIKTV